MVALASRILIIGSPCIPSFKSGPPLHRMPHTPAGIAAQVLFAVQLLRGILFFLIPYFPEADHFGSRRLADSKTTDN